MTSGLTSLSAGLTWSEHAALIERFDLYDRSAEIVADPDCYRRCAIVDEHPADVAVARQEIIRPFAALRIEPPDPIGECVDLPGLAVAVGQDVIGCFPLKRLSSIR